MRGASMISFCAVSDNAEVVAICDKWEQGLEIQKKLNEGMDVAYYTDFDEFIKHDMDAVVLANYAHEHAQFAIKAMKAGKHVYSEVLPVKTMKEAVELIETVEETGMTYAYGENYCFIKAPFEMKKLYREGKIGELEYAEGEYIHNCETEWDRLTRGDENHWRNNMYSTFYCTHSLGPIIHITGLRPVSVTGFESTMNERHLRVGEKSAQFGIEMVTLENGAIVRSTHGELYKDSNWWSMYGSKGAMESSRLITKSGGNSFLYVNADKYSGEYGKENIESYEPEGYEKAKNFGHGGSDFVAMYNFAEKLLGNEEADIIDVYEAMDMCLPGMFAYRSILNGGTPMEIPNLRDKTVREAWRNDTACTYAEAAGDMLWPTMVTGTPKIEPSVYETIRLKWENEMKKEDNMMVSRMAEGRVEKTKKSIY